MGEDQQREMYAAQLLATFLDKHLARGTGNGGKPQKASALAAKAGVSASRISELRNPKGGLTTVGTLESIERAFFPHRDRTTNDPAYREWQEVRRAIAQDGLPNEPGPDDKSLSLRETWDLLTRPVNRNTLSIVRSAPNDDGGVSALHGDQIAGRLMEASFILPMPEWFLDALDADAYLRERYDTHAPLDLSGAPDLAEFYSAVPVSDFRNIVTYHANAYARSVIEALRRRPAYPPYNKPKVGLHGYEQSQRSGQREGVYLDLDFYRTDYFTHRVMRRVLHDVRETSPDLFRDEAVPFEALPYLCYFTTSFGINVVATTQEENEKRFYMALLSDRQGNVNQQERWHVSANEGISLEDAPGGRVDVNAVVARALLEELGHRYDPGADQTLYLEFAIDRLNWEPFISCVAHLGTDRDSFYCAKKHLARDDRREFHEVRDFPFTKSAIIRLLLDNPNGVAGFTAYGLNILNNVLVRGMAG